MRKTLTVLAALALLAAGAAVAARLSQQTFPAETVQAVRQPAVTDCASVCVRRAQAVTLTFPAQTVTGGATTATVPTTTAAAGAAGALPWHTDVHITAAWVGEEYRPSASDGSQSCSTYDADWALHWSGGVSTGVETNSGCTGSPTGGCDGVAKGAGSTFTCNTEPRTGPDYWPTRATPAENPYYLDVPYDDLNNAKAFKDRCQVVPWAGEYPASDCANHSFSYMKDRWVELTANGRTCYAQIEDAGPYVYDDEAYVWGGGSTRPQSRQANNAGADVSPAVTGCLGFPQGSSGYDDDTATATWRFVERADVPDGPWTRIVTSSGVTN